MTGITITFQPKPGEFCSITLGDVVNLESRTGITPGTGVIASETFPLADAAPELQPLINELFAWRSSLLRSELPTWYME